MSLIIYRLLVVFLQTL